MSLSCLPGESWLVALMRRANLHGCVDWAHDAYWRRIALGVSEEEAANAAARECGCGEETTEDDDGPL